MHMLPAELAQGFAKRAHLVEIPDNERKGGLEVALERREVARKERPQVGGNRKQRVVEPRRQLPRLGDHGGIARFDLGDRVPCHNSRLGCLHTTTGTRCRAAPAPRLNCSPKSTTNCANSREHVWRASGDRARRCSPPRSSTKRTS